MAVFNKLHVMRTEVGMRKRIGYGIVTMLLLVIEVLIALFVHDSFIRPYVGDVLVVIVIYFFIRIFIPQHCKLLPLWIFLFAAGVEVLQLFHIVDLLGLGGNPFLRILIGAVFDMKDIVCYAVGCLLLAAYEVILAVPKEERYKCGHTRHHRQRGDKPRHRTCRCHLRHRELWKHAREQQPT